MSDFKYYLISGLITKVPRVGEFENLNDVYKYLLDHGVQQGDYIIIKGTQIL